IILNEFRKLGYKLYSRVLNAADYGAPQIRERLFIVGSREGAEFSWPPPLFSKTEQTSQSDLFAPEDDNKIPGWRTMSVNGQLK
ncbi:MAG: DNA cytosine methyltransferase, partial [Pseudomonadota bacterium]|nr:DNA cytosine methyltransferase [Pseudomonadota bacterium]